MSRRDWCFTAWIKPEPDYDKLKYIIWGEEICPKTLKQHYQGFVITKGTNGPRAIKRIIGANDTTHIEPRRGTRRQASDYCRKDGNVIEFGELEPITNKDLFNKAKEPGGIDYLKNEYPEFYCRYYKGLERLAPKGEKWRGMPKVIVLWGKPGTLKTRTAMESAENVFKLDEPYTWWDGYDGESTIVIDDYEWGKMSRNLLLNICDGYRLRLPVKGAFVWAKWNTVYITTNQNAETWRDAAFERRIAEIRNLTI